MPQDAVVCVKSGYVYERSLIEKHIETTGQEPNTREEVSLADLLPVKSECFDRSRAVAMWLARVHQFCLVISIQVFARTSLVQALLFQRLAQLPPEQSPGCCLL